MHARLAQVFLTLGFIRNPTSSAIRITPSAPALFFKRRPDLLPPGLNTLLVAFAGAAGRLPVGEAQLTEDHAHVIVVIRHALELAGDQLLSPEVLVEPALGRCLELQPGQTLLLPRR